MQAKEQDQINQQIKDYQHLFRYKQSGHLTKYAYDTYGVDWFQSAIQDHSYYIYTEDVKLLETLSIDKLNALNLPKNIYEIGPGCENCVKLKSLTFLQYIKATKYVAIDICELYAKNASAFVNTSAQIFTDYIVCDAFNSLFICSDKERKTALLLGGTLSNFSDSEIHRFFSQLRQSLQQNDYFVTTVDTCIDEAKLEKAYNSYAANNFALNPLRYFNTNLASTDQLNIDSFAPQFKWNKLTSTVEQAVISKIDQDIVIGTEKIHLNQGDRFVVIHSRKNDISNISNIASQHNFNLTDTLSVDGNPMKMLCFKRM